MYSKTGGEGAGEVEVMAAVDEYLSVNWNPWYSRNCVRHPHSYKLKRSKKKRLATVKAMMCLQSRCAAAMYAITLRRIASGICGKSTVLE